MFLSEQVMKFLIRFHQVFHQWIAEKIYCGPWHNAIFVAEFAESILSIAAICVCTHALTCALLRKYLHGACQLVLCTLYDVLIFIQLLFHWCLHSSFFRLSDCNEAKQFFPSQIWIVRPWVCFFVTDTSAWPVEHIRLSQYCILFFRKRNKNPRPPPTKSALWLTYLM